MVNSDLRIMICSFPRRPARRRRRCPSASRSSARSCPAAARSCAAARRTGCRGRRRSAAPAAAPRCSRRSPGRGSAGSVEHRRGLPSAAPGRPVPSPSSQLRDAALQQLLGLRKSSTTLDGIAAGGVACRGCSRRLPAVGRRLRGSRNRARAPTASTSAAAIASQARAWPLGAAATGARLRRVLPGAAVRRSAARRASGGAGSARASRATSRIALQIGDERAARRALVEMLLGAPPARIGPSVPSSSS